MKRREFFQAIAGSAAVWAFTARAQQASMPVVGFLSGRSLNSDAHLVAAFRQGLSESGYVDGQNVVVEFRWAEGQFDRLTPLAAELVDRQVAVIFAGGVDVRIRALRAAISTVPVVFATAGDPVELGLVQSFNRPGGNATAVTVLSAALWPKRLELMRELVGRSALIAVLANPNNATAEASTKELLNVAQDIAQRVLVAHAGSEREFESAFAKIVGERAAALLVGDDALFINRREQLVALAARHAIPAMYGRREFAAAGGLMSYGASTLDQYRQSGAHAGRVLRGVKPAELPVLQPTKFQFVINLKTAKVVGVKISDNLLSLADEVIE